MHLSNEIKASISYQHRQKIKQLFSKHVKDKLAITHFSIDIVLQKNEQKKEIICFSSTPAMTRELYLKDFIDHDSIYEDKIYKQQAFYFWHSVARTETDQVINFIKEQKYGLSNGITIVRKHDDHCFVLYSFASNRDNLTVQEILSFLYRYKANEIAQLGDFLYNSLLTEINQYTRLKQVKMTKLTIFQPIDIAMKPANKQQEIDRKLRLIQGDKT